jgi:hypothetical protein
LKTSRKRNHAVGFAICISAGTHDDLEVGKVYPVLPDPKAAEVDCLRIVDESGEDYLYAARRFLVVDVPESARGRLLRAVRRELAARSAAAH